MSARFKTEAEFQAWRATLPYQAKAQPGGRETPALPESVTIELPWPPSANRYWRMWQGRMVVSSEARQYKLDVAARARLAGLRPTDNPVCISLDLYRPAKRGDLSNRIKIVEDALQGVAYHDDSQVIELHARRFDDKKNPRVEITISSMPNKA
jgi:crossover junction endodeoxyribonuclease RusA